MAVETFGTLVERLIGEGALDPDKGQDTVLAQVWQLVPLHGERREKEIYDTIPKPKHHKAVTRLIDLLKAGKLVVSTGQGRSRRVRRRLRKYSREHDSYCYIRAEIRTRWAGESPHNYIDGDRFRTVLATNGLKRGRCSAPDITLIGGKTLRFLPGKFLDVVTFEVKPTLDITGLYEALAHRTHATHAYLICYNGKEPWKNEPDAAEVGRITREAVRTGVGFILARQPDDCGTWQKIVPATRWSPDPEAMHDFILDMNKIERHRKALRQLRSWLRSDSFLGARPQVDFANLDLSETDQKLAEDIYLEIPLSRDKGVGWKYFEGSIDRETVERIRKGLQKAGVIRVVQNGSMRLPL